MILEVGGKFERRFVVSEEIYKGFIELFHDRNPLHTDNEFAVRHGFSEKVVHGNILNGFLSYFIGECLPLKNVVIHSQEIQYHQAVYQLEELNFEAIVSAVHESVNTIEFKFNFRNRHSKVIAKGKIQIGILS